MSDLFNHGQQAAVAPADAWHSIGNLAANLMSDVAMARKLDLIAGLEKGEIEGWQSELRGGTRPPFPGESAALAMRQRQLARR